MNYQQRNVVIIHKKSLPFERTLHTMAHGNEKGIVLKLQGEVIEGSYQYFHIDTAISYLNSLRGIADEKGWVAAKVLPNNAPTRRCTHYIKPLPAKPQYRQTKIVGPTHYKQAG